MVESGGGLHKRNVQQVDGNVAIQDAKALVENQHKVPSRGASSSEINDDSRK